MLSTFTTLLPMLAALAYIASALRLVCFQRNGARIRMGSELAAQRTAQQGLQLSQTDVRQQHAASQLKKQETRRNDPTFADWSAQPLPAAARRLHERPALSGAGDYRAWLSRRNALQPAASGAAQ